MHIPTWWLELAFSITQPNFMAASYLRKCLVSRQLLYFEEIKGFPFIYGNDILKNLKGWPSFTKGYAEYVYIFCFDRIFFVLERDIYNYFRTNLQLCKVVSGRKERLCGTQISMMILLFKQHVGASMCKVSFTKE